MCFCKRRAASPPPSGAFQGHATLYRPTPRLEREQVFPALPSGPHLPRPGPAPSTPGRFGTCLSQPATSKGTTNPEGKGVPGESVAKVTPATGKPQSPCCRISAMARELPRWTPKRSWAPGEVTGLPSHLGPALLSGTRRQAAKRAFHQVSSHSIGREGLSCSTRFCNYRPSFLWLMM